MSTRIPARSAASCLAALLVLFAPVLPAAGEEQTLPPEGHQEERGDPQVRLSRQQALRSPSAVVVRGNFVSVQVNVDAAGNNIVGDAANEPSMAIDPGAPDNIVIGWRQFDTVSSNFRQAGHAYSHDAGVSWVFPGVLQPGQFRSDPVLSADNDGTFFYYSLSTVTTVEMFISNDKGLSWLGPFPAFGGDKEWMIADVSGSAGAGHIYALWNSQFTCCDAGTDFTRSTDGGFIYEGPFVMPQKVKWGTLDVSADGRLFVVGSALNTQAVPAHYVMRSSNSSDSAQAPIFETTVPIDLGGTTVAGAPPNPGGLLGQVWIATDRGPRPGNVYVLGSVNPPGGDAMDVRFTRSTDLGLTWSSSIQVNDDLPLNPAYQWFGAMSVAPDGRIDVTWYDTRSDPSATISEVYYAYSTNAGVSWSGSIPVSPPFNSIVGHPNQNKIGDYTQMVSDNVGAGLAYAATFNNEQDVWFLRVGDCNANGVHDSKDIDNGSSEDCDDNGHPDECEDLTEVCDDGIDNDCNAATDCADDACIGDPACDCDFDGSCDLGEDCRSCPSDCATGPVGCGNGVCESNTENCLTCPEDCAGLQSGNPNDQFCCGSFEGATNPVSCRDARCNVSGFECNRSFVPACCGDLTCEREENPCGCAVDCGPQSSDEQICGDGVDNDCDGGTDCADDDCLSALAPPPDGAPHASMERRSSGYFLRWQVAGGATYDVVQGELDLLRVGGDFANSTSGCLADDVTELELETPTDGAQRWYLVRPTFCQGPGSYDTGTDGQVAPRDAGIDASGVCP